MFAEVLARNAIDIHSPVGLRIGTFIKTLQVCMHASRPLILTPLVLQQNASLFTSCVSVLSPAQQEALKQILV